MEITFKDVGQGDSIIITWKKDDNSEGIGIIDCCRKGRENPVLIHIKERSIQKIDFIILTHPHSDHYSGMLELLSYCEQQHIKVEVFWNTTYLFLTQANCKRILNTYFRGNDPLNNNQFDLLHQKISQLSKSQIIKNHEIPVSFPKYLFNSQSNLRFLAPNRTEQDEFIRKVELNEKFAENRIANLFSTLIYIDINQSLFVLLTSDTVLSVFERILGEEVFENKKIILGQMPHHGAMANHSIAFWRHLKHESNTPIAISVGKNIYGHPSKKAIEEMEEEYYKIYRTSIDETKSNILDTDIYTHSFIESKDLRFEISKRFEIAKLID